MGGVAHRPVMVPEVLEYLKTEKGKVIVDGTVGAGGHAESILGHIMPGGRLVAIDRDPAAVAEARERLGKVAPAVSYYCENFRNIRSVLDAEGIGLVDGILMDLGISSIQLEDPDRGFSYRMDGPLDMKMGPDASMSAEEIINKQSEDEITRILYSYGEERWARRIAHFIIETRKRRPILTTQQLVEIILNAVPAGARRGRKHPARKTFQALRIAVNHELEDLREGISRGIECLALAGRMVILTYQSLEDRIVKNTFSSLAKGSAYPPGEPLSFEPTLRILTRRPVRPVEKETIENPRSRSAKLRAAEKISYAEDEAHRGKEIT
jgi:16S rRNA (cytosine1402-N4)-methyltransferase